MTVVIKLKSVRHSGRKLAPVTRLFVGKGLTEAIEATRLMPNQSAYLVNKALKMALAAAKQKEFVPETLYIKELFATQGPRVGRIRPNARARTNRYQKHLAHLVVKVDERQEAGQSLSKQQKVSKEVKSDGPKS